MRVLFALLLICTPVAAQQVVGPFTENEQPPPGFPVHGDGSPVHGFDAVGIHNT